MQRRTHIPTGGDHTRAVIMYSHRRDALPPGVLTEIVSALKSRCLVQVWLPQTERCASASVAAHLRAMGVPVRYVPLPPSARSAHGSVGWASYALEVHRLRRFLRHESFDLMYLTGMGTAALAPVVRAVGHRRVILHVSGELDRTQAHQVQRVARSCDHLVVSTPRTRDLLTPHRWPTVTVVPDRVPERAAAVQPRRPPRYLAVARWASGSGYLGLLRAWNAAGCPGELELVGGDAVGDSTNALSTLVGALVANSNTVRVGLPGADLIDRLSEFDAVIFPAEIPDALDALPQAVISRGLPCLAARGIRLDASFQDGVSGWRFSSGNTAELSELLRRLGTTEFREAAATPRTAADPLRDVVGTELGNVSKRRSATSRDYAHEPVREITPGRTTGARSQQR